MEKYKIIQFSPGEYREILKTKEGFLEKGVKEDPPKFRIICGPPGTGKTRYRREKYQEDYVVIDEGDIYARLKPILTNDEKYANFIDFVIESLIDEAIKEQKNILIEVLMNEMEPMKTIMDKMIALGYKPEIEYIHNDIEKSWQNNISRGEDNISAFYSQDNLFKWFLNYFEENKN